MIILGLLLILGTAGLSFAALRANESVFTAPAGTIELFGYKAHMTIGDIYFAGAIAGAIVMLSLVMLFGGMGRHARRSAAMRQELRRADEAKTVEREKVPSGR
jgi:hypothetical protein